MVRIEVLPMTLEPFEIQYISHGINHNESHLSLTSHNLQEYGNTTYMVQMEEILIDMVFIPLFCLLGLFINIITAVLLCLNSLNATRFYLLLISFYDSLALAFIFCVRILYFSNGKWDRVHEIHDEISTAETSQTILDESMKYEFQLRAINWMLQISFHLSNWMTVVMAVDRIVGVRAWYSRRKQKSLKCASEVSLLILATTLVMYLPHFFRALLLSHEQMDLLSSNMSLDTNNSLCIQQILRWLTIPGSQFYIYRILIDMVVGFNLPVIILLCVNVCLILEVRRSTAFLMRQAHMSILPRGCRQRKVREIHVTCMLVCLVTVFFVCQLPTVFYSSVKKLFALNMLRGTSEAIVAHCFTMAYVVKSGIYFGLYCWFSEQFRKFTCCWRGHVDRVMRPMLFTLRLSENPSVRSPSFRPFKASSSSATRFNCLNGSASIASGSIITMNIPSKGGYSQEGNSPTPLSDTQENFEELLFLQKLQTELV